MRKQLGEKQRGIIVKGNRYKSVSMKPLSAYVYPEFQSELPDCIHPELYAGSTEQHSRSIQEHT